MYWIVKLDDFVSGSTTISVIALLIIIAALAVYVINNIEGHDVIIAKTTQTTIKIALLVGIVFGVCAIFIPNTKQMCAIMVIPRIINSAQDNKALMNLPDDIIMLGSKWIQKISSDLDSTKVGKHAK
jgi:glucan phosphoethanolaminetransferase (alkaline phosphatase superfamily)